MAPSTSSTVSAFLPARLRPYMTLSYPVWGVEHGKRVILYKKGRNDVHFVLFVTVLFTFLRHVVMNYLFAPFANYFIRLPQQTSNGVDERTKERRKRAALRKKQHAVSRFAEQGWSMLYCLVMESVGLIILSRIPNPSSPEQLWGTYPYTPLPWLTKMYYLVQLAWWFHQVYVINTERRRKDHWQMFFHHLISIALVSLSYMGNYARVGTIVHTLMDLCDILLPLAKILRYLELKTACDICFVFFLVGWLCTRQIGLAMVTWSATFEAPKYIPFQWNPAKQIYLTRPLYCAFIGLLLVLLILCSIWFYMALMVAVRVLRGQGAEDSRSDSEDDGESVDGSESGSVSNGETRAKSTALNGNGHAGGVKKRH